ncbi:unnamed protein product [Cuscuta campestris]|uniref:Protein kinase domain-containing protein n=1 Tax=Cuscuta campestris TaxID=132261 RepID=A0A484KMI0_9ASTE|nr:unnamed protein product [Cuscuta campestris]
MRLTGHQLSELTMNFSRSRVIAYGGFSTVYLGTAFPGSVHPVAIKTVDCGTGACMSSIFNQELQILQRVQHDRIVGVLGYSDEGGVGALVLPYVPNGTLWENLSSSVLPWKNRVGIAYQLAEALEYLHEKCDPHIVHGDVKSSNVLLDSQFNCKLCDFGSAKTGFSSDLVMSRSRKMIGSPGYTDPHYLRTGIATKKSDMYSFGVVLLELITGLEAISSLKSSRVWEDESGVAKMVDPRLAGGEYELEEAMAVASIAASCLADSPTSRPSATDVLKILRNRVPAVGFLFSMGKGT